MHLRSAPRNVTDALREMDTVIKIARYHCRKYTGEGTLYWNMTENDSISIEVITCIEHVMDSSSGNNGSRSPLFAALHHCAQAPLKIRHGTSRRVQLVSTTKV